MLITVLKNLSVGGLDIKWNWLEMTGLNWILKNYLLKCSGYKLMFLVQNVLLSLWL